MNINQLKNRHYGKPGFCLGTAPHLNNIDLNLLKDNITIGCNQLAYRTEELNLNYLCFQRELRIEQVKEILNKVKSSIILPQQFINNQKYKDYLTNIADNIIPINTRFATPGHSEIFSFDLSNCIYTGDTIAMEIQLAVWMGCNPIYILGVDAKYTNQDKPFYDDTKISSEAQNKIEKYTFPDLKEWLQQTKRILWTRGIKLFNAAGEHSSLEVLPKIRLRAAVGKPVIGVTSKTFSKDKYLVNELQRYFTNVRLNDNKDELKDKKLVNFLNDCDGVILGTENFDAKIIDSLECLRFVSKYGVGLNNIDFDAAKRKEIDIFFKKGVNSDSVAELVLGFTFNLIRKMDHSIQSYRNNKWAKLPGRELSELTIGIIGYGNVGKVTAAKFAALGSGRILVNDLIDFPQSPPCEFVPLDYLLSESDIVTLHIDAEKRNYNFVNETFLNKMKAGSYLINTSRGTIVDEDALVDIIESGKISGAALDVYKDEPSINSKLKQTSNLLTTCHIAGSSNRAIKNMGWAAIEGLLKLLNINPIY